MNKTAIKNFAIEARKKLISEITYRAGLVGITKNGNVEPIHKADGIEMYNIGASDPYTIMGEQLKQRKSLASRVKEKGFDNVIEEVAYTWFNRIIAVRFMEVNDYLPTRVRVLSSETAGKIEPDIVTEAPNVDLGFSSVEIDEILQLKHDNKLDELFRMLFIKQCNALNEILPELFEKTSDFTELLLSISFTNEDSIVRLLINSVEEEDFKEQVEIIGWMYQYYNTELKDDTFAKLKANVKITKERIPAVTQLFTPDWIVRYMVENSLGRLWIEGHPDSDIKANWKYYLEEAEQETDVKVQLEELRADAKNIKPEDIKVIDPCMGSGHILVYAFDVLWDIYKSCGYAKREAARLILENNLYGLDIDDRAYQFAYFAVMMRARGYSRRILNEGIKPNLCAIQESNGTISELKELLDYFVQGVTEIEKVRLKTDLEYLIGIFKDAKEYGSILDVKKIDFEAIERRIEEIRNEGSYDLFAIQYRSLIIEQLVPLVKQAKIMARKYDVLVTNPSYMGSSGMSCNLKTHIERNYNHSKNDLFSVFIEVCLNLTTPNRKTSLVTMHSWMFLSSFEELRDQLLQNYTMENILHLGMEAFENIIGKVVSTVVFICTKNIADSYKPTAIRLVDYYDSQRYQKEQQFFNPIHRYDSLQLKDFKKISGYPFVYWLSKKEIEIFVNNMDFGSYYSVVLGLKTGDNEKFLRLWFEINFIMFSNSCFSTEQAKVSKKKWFPYSKGGRNRKWYGNLELCVNYEDDGRDLKIQKNSSFSGIDRYFNKGITWTGLTGEKTSFRDCTIDGCVFDTNKGPMIYEKDISIYAALSYLNSCVSERWLNCLNPTLSFQTGDIKRLPFIIPAQKIMSNIIEKAKKTVRISKTDWDSFETSWDFVRHPLLLQGNNNVQNTIQESFESWNSLTKNRVDQLKLNEEEINRIFIEIYDLHNELTPDVEEKDIIIRKADLDRDVSSFISYAVGCLFGRYSLDVDGLAYAGGDWDGNKYKTFIPDADNIVSITDEEYFNDDIVARFVEFVKVTYGADTLEENLDFIANAIGNKGNTSKEVIRQYFLKDFYKNHVKTYHKKPIYWLFDSGKENGFKALIYMHRYNQDTVARVRADYLHKTQKAIESAISRADMVIDSAANPSQKAKAVKDKTKLVKQLAETKVYDAAIGHIAAQRIPIDLDDGVTVNYAKFQSVEVSSEGKKVSKIDLLGKI